jgi:hypothetical protein
MEHSMRAIFAAVMIALLTLIMAQFSAPSLAQRNLMQDDKKKTHEPKKPADDKDYKSALERMPDQKFDPWRNMR